MRRRRRGTTRCSRRTTPARTAASPSPELSPRMFSFNNPYGACPSCTGLGTQLARRSRASSSPTASLSILRRRHPGLRLEQRPRRLHLAACILTRCRRNTISSLTRPSVTCRRRRCDVILYGTGGEKLTLHYERAARQAARSSSPFEGVVNQPRAPLPRDAEPTPCARSSRSACPKRPARTAAASRLPEVRSSPSPSAE